MPQVKVSIAGTAVTHAETVCLILLAGALLDVR